MTELQKQFFSRLNIKEKESVSFTDLNELLYAMAQAVPFENLTIIHGKAEYHSHYFSSETSKSPL